MIATRSLLVAVWLLVAGCSGLLDKHGFTDVVETKPSPDGALVAALVWEERGMGKPHTSGIVVVAKGGDPLTGTAVLLQSEDFRNVEYRWTGANALEIRLPCGQWSSLANHWLQPETKRVVEIDFLSPKGCVAKPGTTALPPGATQPAALQLSPN
ncbi:hypothetical protein KZX46_04670 [Polymorphobacter sp. PAMC 29334]|uniref:hypothetical protein n=1 Tax=Polymorphobacter sp. PAMC 29334 TaxID=2862331 RepID=UPI001C74C307|nr:hypothetical protein [Polymorphobacter sp. PAMC 29334]QYE35291.1 hypothetical protein KZX46_04670 [Polymorphobacter sp. PAMC 29334]